MTQELRTQRDDIVRARDVLDSRRRFTEAVLAGASAGVIGVDAEGQVSILNRSAEKLIGQVETESLGRPLKEVVPELVELFTSARIGTQRLVQGQVTINRNGRDRILSCGSPVNSRATRITAMSSRWTTSPSWWRHNGRPHGPTSRAALPMKSRTRSHPSSFCRADSAQIRVRHQGRCCHIFPVYRHDRASGRRHQADGRRILSIRPLPKPVMGIDDVADVLRQTVFLQRVGNADIDIDVNIADGPMPARFDRRLISQALTNIIKMQLKRSRPFRPRLSAGSNSSVCCARWRKYCDRRRR